MHCPPLDERFGTHLVLVGGKIGDALCVGLAKVAATQRTFTFCRLVPGMNNCDQCPVTGSLSNSPVQGRG